MRSKDWVGKIGYDKGTKVKVLTLTKDNTGTVTYNEPLGEFSSLDSRHFELKHWVRMDNGALLKDVTNSELESFES